VPAVLFPGVRANPNFGKKGNWNTGAADFDRKCPGRESCTEKSRQILSSSMVSLPRLSATSPALREFYGALPARFIQNFARRAPGGGRRTQSRRKRTPRPKRKEAQHKRQQVPWIFINKSISFRPRGNTGPLTPSRARGLKSISGSQFIRPLWIFEGRFLVSAGFRVVRRRILAQRSKIRSGKACSGTRSDDYFSRVGDGHSFFSGRTGAGGASRKHHRPIFGRVRSLDIRLASRFDGPGCVAISKWQGTRAGGYHRTS